jgi:FG-GAP-like repeat
MEKYNRYRHCLSLIFISIILIGDGVMALDDNSLRTQKDDRISRISYENRRQAYSHIESLPVIGDARAVFKYPDGSLGLIINKLVTWPGNGTLETAQPTILNFYRQVNSQWVMVTDSVFDSANSVPGCVHTRKTIAADYNQDGVVDFVIACTGWDDRPFPGERSRVLLSQANGRYKMDYFSTTVAYQHGGAAADLNDDGYPDLIMTNINGVDVFINDRTGHFVKSKDLTIPQQRRAFHVELVDVNGDDRADFVAGSHEWNDATRIILNPGNNNFGGALFNRPQEIVIPSVPGGGVITDFLYVKSINALYVVRTGDGQRNGTRFYEGLWIQKFALDTRISTVVYANPDWHEPGRPGRKWLDWVVEKDGNIQSEVGSQIMIPIR